MAAPAARRPPPATNCSLFKGRCQARNRGAGRRRAGMGSGLERPRGEARLARRPRPLPDQSDSLAALASTVTPKKKTVSQAVEKRRELTPTSFPPRNGATVTNQEKRM